MRPGTERYQLPRENPSSSSSNLVIDPVVETDTGDYECWAKQDWGEGTVKTKLKVKEHLVASKKNVTAVVVELLLGEKSRNLEGKMKVVSDLFFFICSRF